MKIGRLVTIALSLLVASGAGCVARSQYDQLRTDYDALQMRMNATTNQAGTERQAMMQQFGQQQSAAQRALSEQQSAAQRAIAEQQSATQRALGDVSNCQMRLSEQQRINGEVKAKLEQAIPLLTFILSGMGSTALPPASVNQAGGYGPQLLR